MLIKKGDIFSSTCDIITNPTNSVGIMGGGLAAAFHIRYPEVCDHYNSLSLSRQINTKKLTRMEATYYPVGSIGSNNKAIIMFATKVHWKNPSEYSYIKDGLEEVLNIVRGTELSIAFPALGCGLGGLDFAVVRDMIMNAFEGLDNYVELYEP